MKKSLLTSVFFLSFYFSSFSQITTVQQIVNSVNQDSLVYFVRELSGDVQTSVNGSLVTIASRHKYQPGNELAKDYIRQKLESYGLTATIQSFSSSGNNVIGTQTGTDLPNQKFIICAHYDDMPSGSIAPGADDNASGTAAVIEAARILSQYSFPYTILYALWDEEEQGLVGSEYYAGQAANAGDSIIGVINLDMIAWDSDDNGVINIHTENVGITFEIYDKLVEVNNLYNIDLNIVEVPSQPYSDHESFLSNGYSAVLIIEDDNDFHQYYHTVNDKIMYFNQPYFHKMSQLAIGALATYALNLNINIVHTPIASMEISQDVETSIQIFSGLDIGSGAAAPRLYYRTDSGSGFGEFSEVTGTSARDNATFNFTIPAPALGSMVQYYVAVQDENSTIAVTLPSGGGGFNPPGNIPPSEFYQFYVGPTTYALIDNATNLNDWTQTGGWGITTLKYTSAPSSFTDSPSGNYVSNTTSDLTYTENINLENALGAYLEFETQWNIETDWDYGMVQVSTNNGANWIALEGNYTNSGTGSFQPNGQPLYDGAQTTWVHEIIDLSDYAGRTIKLRFYFRSDTYEEEDGWYIDDISVSVFNPVPVELVSFNANLVDNSVVLNWITATEINNNGFEIEKRADNDIDWKSAGFVKGFGTTTEINNYSFTDSKPGYGVVWYRLKQTDYDGSFEYHGPIKVENTITDFALNQNYPNPFNPVTTIEYIIPNSSFVHLSVYDILGNKVSTLINEEKEAGVYNVKFDASQFASGTYIYRLQAGESAFIKKMILLR